MEPQVYASRRKALRRALPQGLLLFPALEEASRNYPANTYPFRQDSHFLYYTGLSVPGIALALFPDGREILYADELPLEDLVWFGPMPTPGDLAERAGIQKTAPLKDLARDLREAQSRGEEILYLPPYRDSQVLKLHRLLEKDPDEARRGWSRDLAKAVAAQRSVKTEEEVREIEKALAVTEGMYQAAFRITRPGLREAQVAGALQGAALAQERQQAFPPIISVHGEVLHSMGYSNLMEEGQLLVVDSGAESPLFYASDVTRTLPVTGKFDPRQKEIYQVVLSAQKEAIAKASPRVTNKELHLLASRVIAEGLKELGLMKGDPEEAVAAGAHALFFPHGLGHMLGLDVHDMEDLGEDIVGYAEGEERSRQFGLSYLRLARKLEPGFVLTVEPGIYFIPALVESWESKGKFKDFIDYPKVREYLSFGGIRIEDDILITETGCRILSAAIPKEPDEVESVMQD